MKSYGVYLAAPWFSPEQEELHDAVLALLRQHTTGVRAPREIIICPPNADAHTRHKIFRSNCDEIRRADIVVAITDGKDPGTLWEMGYAFHCGAQVVGCAFTLGDKPFNLMLAEGCVVTCRSLPELDAVLRYYNEYSKLPAQDWEGTVE